MPKAATSTIGRKRKKHSRLGLASKPLEAMAHEIDAIGTGSEDMTRRSIVQNSVSKVLLPLKQAHGELVLAASAASSAGNHRVDAYRRLVQQLSDRIGQRRADIEAA